MSCIQISMSIKGYVKIQSHGRQFGRRRLRRLDRYSWESRRRIISRDVILNVEFVLFPYCSIPARHIYEGAAPCPQ